MSESPNVDDSGLLTQWSTLHIRPYEGDPVEAAEAALEAVGVARIALGYPLERTRVLPSHTREKDSSFRFNVFTDSADFLE